MVMDREDRPIWLGSSWFLSDNGGRIYRHSWGVGQRRVNFIAAAFAISAAPKIATACEEGRVPIRRKAVASVPTTPPAVPAACTLPLAFPTPSKERAFAFIRTGVSAPRAIVGRGKSNVAAARAPNRLSDISSGTMRFTGTAAKGKNNSNVPATARSAATRGQGECLSAIFPPMEYPAASPVMTTAMSAPHTWNPDPKAGVRTLTPNTSKPISANPAANAVAYIVNLFPEAMSGI